MSKSLTENDYRVLYSVLDRKENKGLSKANGITIEEIKGKLDLSESKIRDALKLLIEHNYIEKGIKKVRKDTFFMTALGLNELTNIRDTSVKITKGDE